MCMNYKRIEVLVEDDILKEFKIKLIDKGEDMSGLIRKWIKTYLKKEVTNSLTPVKQKLKKVMEETEKKYSLHDFGPTGEGICFRCKPPHRKATLS